MTSANRRNLIAVALPLFLLLVLIAVMRFVSAGIRFPVSPQAIGGQNPSQMPLLPADPAAQKAIAAAVTGQIDALRSGEYERALGFSTDAFRGSITPKRFGEVIQTQYSPLVTSKGQTITPARVQDTRAAVEVIVTGTDATSNRRFGFTLIREGDDWKIVSCTPLRDAGRRP